MKRTPSTKEVLLAYGATNEVLAQYDFVPSRVERVGSSLCLTTESALVRLMRTRLHPRLLRGVIDICRRANSIRPDLVASVIPNLQGEPFTSGAEYLYYAVKVDENSKANLHTDAGLKRGASLLGEWHRLAEDSQHVLGGLEHPSHPWVRLRTLKRRVLDIQRLNKAAGDKFYDLWREHARHVIDRLEAAHRTLEENMSSFTTVRKTFVCHGGFVQRNLFFGAKTDGLLVCENAYRGPCEFELALYLHRYMPHMRWNTNVLKNAIFAYQRGFGSQRLDHQLLSVFLMIPMRALQLLTWYTDKKRVDIDFLKQGAKTWELESERDAAVRSIDSGWFEALLEADIQVATHVIAPQASMSRPVPEKKRNRGKMRRIRRGGRRVVRHVKLKANILGERTSNTPKSGLRLFSEPQPPKPK